METFEALRCYYAARDEDARFSPNHGRVEFLTTMRYIEKYLRSGMRVLEVGAGTGRYSHAIAQNGYEVDAVELLPDNIEAFRARTRPGERVTIRMGDATDMPFIKSGAYDMVLLLGPMYHLFSRGDQLRALTEALRAAKEGGIVFAAYCGADAAILQTGFLRGRARELIDAGMLNPETFETHSDPKDIFELYRKADVDALMAGLPARRLHFVGTDMAANYMRETLDDMDDDAFELFMRYHFTICERPDLVGASNHMLDIFAKE